MLHPISVFLVFCNIKLFYACVTTNVLSMYKNKRFEGFNENELLMSQGLIMSPKIPMLTELWTDQSSKKLVICYIYTGRLSL